MKAKFLNILSGKKKIDTGGLIKLLPEIDPRGLTGNFG